MNCTYSSSSPPGPAGSPQGSWCTDGTTATTVQVFTSTNDPASGANGFIFDGEPSFKVDNPTTGMWVCQVMARTTNNPTAPSQLVNAAIYYPGQGQYVKFTPQAGCTTSNTPQPPLTVYDYSYTDATTSCSYTYNLKDVWIGGDGFPRLAWEINGDTSQSRAACQGGRIAGYVWTPTETDRHPYNPEFDFDGGGPGGGRPPWDFVPDWAGIANLILRVMEYNDPGDLYRLVSVCETDAQGEPISQSVEVTIPPGIRNQGASTRVRLAAIVQLLQGLKDFKQPTCNSRPTYSGTPVTVRFQSDAPSPAGERPLRKHLRYRDTLSNPLEVHTDHWADFEWDAGPVIVTHTGGPWGVCKVWAKSVDEGKRVIRHAGVAAGVDPDAQGRWIISGSADPRYGQTGRMRVERRSGAICVSSRPGPSGLPLIAYPSAGS